MKRNKSKKFKKLMVTTTAAASILVNRGYDSPFEIIDDSESDTIDEYQQDEKTPFKRRFKLLLSKIPQPIRAIIIFPLWYIGWLLLTIMEPLYDLLIAPYLSTILYWLCFFLIVVLSVIVASIFIFPALPISKTINKKTITIALVLTVVVAIVDKLLTIYYPVYDKYCQIFKFSCSCIMILALLVYSFIKNRKVKIIMKTDKYQFHN